MVDISPFLGHYQDFDPETHEFTSELAEVRQQVRALFDGTQVRRFHTMPTVTENNIGQHSHGVAMICFLIMEYQISKELLLKALTHDMAEQYTGDVPSPSKRALGVRKEFGEVEDQLLATVNFLVHVTPLEEQVLKLADCADGMLFCARERMLGNRSKMIKHAYKNYCTYVHAIMVELEDSRVKRRVELVFKAVSRLWKESNHE
jgi:5'-deoxynucleotidase YfbR-like HD superfamily hydrolase